MQESATVAVQVQAMVAAPQGFNVSHMLQPALSIIVSVGLGALGGTALGALLNAKPTAMPRTVAALSRVLPQPVIARYYQVCMSQAVLLCNALSLLSMHMV